MWECKAPPPTCMICDCNCAFQTICSNLFSCNQYTMYTFNHNDPLHLHNYDRLYTYRQLWFLAWTVAWLWCLPYLEHDRYHNPSGLVDTYTVLVCTCINLKSILPMFFSLLINILLIVTPLSPQHSFRSCACIPSTIYLRY